MTVEFTTDWLNFTITEMNNRVSTDCPYPNENTWEVGKSGRGYDTTLTNDMGVRLSWHSERKDMGVHVQYSGGCLNRWRELTITPRLIAEYHHKRHDRCSRIDLAIDAKNEGLSILKLSVLVRKGKALTRTDKFSHIKSQDGGETLYLGSRTSEMFMRIYNKFAEQGSKPEHPVDWIRIELECKGERAKQIGVVLANRTDLDMALFARGLIKDFVDFPYLTWQRIVGDTPIHIGKSQEKSGKTREWLLETVAPAMARYVSETGDRAIIADFEAYLKVALGEQNS